ncbi:MAG: hypothetical protein AAF652_07105 [Cyanobacteria bacterium P01_C01_bin.72]
MNSNIVLCIPTSFKNRQELAAALENKHGVEYVLMGRIFRSTVSSDSCEIEIIRNRDRFSSMTSSLADDFELAGQDKLDFATLQQIHNCPQIIYLTSTDSDYAGCLRIANLARVLLQVGGIAIKVESSGLAHSGEKWLTNCDSHDVFDIYSLYVVLVEGKDHYYSCGMHNFGKADVTVSIESDVGLAIYVMNVFNYYRLTESPILQDGHTFQPDIECPHYRLEWVMDRESPAHSPQHNPHGRWYLALDIEH